ncbi:MAG: acyl-CoA reductase [bacterium]
MQIHLPVIVKGKQLHTKDVQEVVTLSYENDLQIVLPDIEKLSPEEIIPEPFCIANLSVDEITSVVSRVGHHIIGDKEKLVNHSKLISQVTGYPPEVAGRDLYAVADMMAGQERLYSMLECELGTFHALDEWLPSKCVYRRAIPRGLIYHVMVGNVPAAALYTLIRSILIKGASIAKLPSRDPITALCFAQAFVEVIPNHPVTHSITVGYWDHNCKLHQEILNRSGAVSVWGGDKACEEVQKATPTGVPILVFGPKRSLSIVQLQNSEDGSDAARRLVHDIISYDQEACFSTQMIFAYGETDGFADILAKWMMYIQKARQPGITFFDNAARRSQFLLQAKILGVRIITSEPGKPPWAVLETSDKTAAAHLAVEHPFTRTVIIVKVDGWRDVLPWIDRNTQTVGLYPWSIQEEVRDEVALCGADRMCEVGRNDRPRAGFTHDSYLPLQFFVRWICIDRPSSYRYKHWYATPKEIDDAFYGKLEEVNKLGPAYNPFEVI